MRPAALIYISHQEVYTKLEEAFLARECKEEGEKKKRPKIRLPRTDGGLYSAIDHRKRNDWSAWLRRFETREWM
jgi:hypothetical protein